MKVKQMYFLRRLRIALVKKQIISLLGEKCASCDNQNWRVLQIDHVKSRGSSESRSESYWLRILKEIKRGSKEYQLLCSNCNYLKELKGREHKRKYVDIPTIFEFQGLLEQFSPEELKEQFLGIRPRMKNHLLLCSKCGRYLPKQSFSPSYRNRFGVRCICKECRKRRDSL